MNKLYGNKGYTLLFAALTAALVLGVAVFILSVSRKQYILASTARDSMFSIYAADSGIECVALRNGDLSGTGAGPEITKDQVDSGFVLDCNGDTFSINHVSYGDNHPSFLGGTEVRQASGYIDTGGTTCAEIIVTVGKDSNSVPKKVFDSRGYNLCTRSGSGVQPNVDSPRTVERALRLTYLGVW